MKTRILPKILLGAGVCACAFGWAAKDPVIMTVNGVDVPKSEFEYLYHKNSQQQLAAQPLEEYVEMFKNYRLKVADALANGIDTTATFRQEMEQYRSDLAAPYLADSVFLNRLVSEAYDRSRKEVEAIHIMMFKGRSDKENQQARATIDSIRQLVLAGGDFAQLARENSQDRASSQNGGRMGWISAGKYPYNFEVAAFSLKPGEISGIIESPMGYHLLKGGKSRPARGEVHVSHIMKMVSPAAGPGVDAAAKATIDSLYNIVKDNKGRFEMLAMQYSDDKNSGRNGGALPWFGAGAMVEDFDSVAFSLPVGGISEPVRSRFGWHIIYKFDERGVPSLNEMKAGELQRISNPQDERYAMVAENQTAMLARRHNAALDKAALDRMKLALVVDGLDSLFYQEYREPANRDMVIGRIGKRNLTAGQLAEYLNGAVQTNPEIAEKMFDQSAESFFNRLLLDEEEARLEAEVPEYRNLLHEYINGSLLYEISVRKVWDEASKNEDALRNHFELHRQDYNWTEPKAKGILVQAANDSVAQAIAARYAELPKDDVLRTLRREFKGKMSADRVLASQGQNAMVDNLMFGAPETKPANSAYEVYFMLDGKVIDAPEDYRDVRGQVTGDYQELLEQQWLEELHRKYPVYVNEKVLKKVK